MRIRAGLALAVIVIAFMMPRSAAAQQCFALPQQRPDADALPLLIADFSIGSETALVSNYSVAPPVINPAAAVPPPDAWYPSQTSFPHVIATSGEAATASAHPVNALDYPQPLAMPRVIAASCESADLPPPPPDSCDYPRPIAPQSNACQGCPGSAVCGASSSGFYAGAEVTLLRPFAGELNEAELSVPLLGVDFLRSDPGDQIAAAPRLWIGYTAPNGAGVRARYWQFDQRLSSDNTNTLILPPGSERMSVRRLNAFAVDIEMTQHGEQRIFIVDVGVGMRIGGIERDRSVTYSIPTLPKVALAFDRDFTGIGPTMSVEIRRPLGDSDFTFLLNPRGTMMFGTVDTTLAVNDQIGLTGASTPIINVALNNDAEAYVAEVRMGFEWTHEMPNGRDMFAHVLWENQFWAGSGVGLSGVGLTGCTFGIGMRH
jgi:hypothetical protein